MTVQVMWKVPAWGMTFQLPQQNAIIRIASQGEFTKCSSFQISHLIVTAKYTRVWTKTWVVLIENIKNQHFPQSESEKKFFFSFQDMALAYPRCVLFYPVIRRRKTCSYIIKVVTTFCSGNLVCYIRRPRTSRSFCFKKHKQIWSRTLS